MDDVMELDPIEVEESAEDGAERAQGEAHNEQTEGDAEKTPITSLFDETGQKINPAVKALLADLKKTNPGADKLLSKAVFRYAELMREFPAGIAEARELRDKVSDLGGLDGIETKLEAAKQFDTLASAFENADPAFVDDLIESYPDSFKALGPVFLQKYAESDPEAFTAYLGRAMHSDLSSSGFLLTFQRLSDFLPTDNPTAANTYKALATYLSEIGALATKAPTAPKAKAAPAKSSDADSRDNELTAREWKIERDSLHKTVASKAYKEALAGRSADSEESAQISELFLSRAQKLTRQMFPELDKRLNGFIARKDKAGYFRYLNTVYQRVIPNAVKSAVDSTMRHKAAGKTGTTAQAANRMGGALPRTEKTGSSAPAGFTPVAKMPGPYEIDYNRTSKQMIEKNQAVLTNGKKVAWR